MPEHQAVPQQEISNAIAQLYKSRLGRGPTKVVTSISGSHVLCVLEDTDTPIEATLLELGGRDLVHEARARLQHGARGEMVAIVERVTGRRVRGHVPGYSTSIDAATEVFLLEDDH
jgi:uncharacterized protein YbcI